MIERYEFGRIKIDGQEYDEDLLLLPNQKPRSCWVKKRHSLTLDDLGDFEAEVLIVGTGDPGYLEVAEGLKSYLIERKTELLVGPTRKVIEEYNKLEKNKKVAGFFHLTC